MKPILQLLSFLLAVAAHAQLLEPWKFNTGADNVAVGTADVHG